jgi:hypothetical protein
VAPASGSESPPATGPELFEGTVEEFYEVPDPLPFGAPGELIRVQDVSHTADAVTQRIMYHSRDASGDDRAVTGIVTYPTTPPPEGGWPVVSEAHGTVGMASHCAPSRHGSPVFTYGIPGVGVATDYVGLGPIGELHPYLSRPSEAHSVIDAVRAARNLPASGAGTRWLTVGGSQGGHAVIATNELADGYAPELDLLGAAAFAPGAVFDQVYGGVDPLVTLVITFMMLYGAEGEHPEIDVDDYVGPAAAAPAQVLRTGCLGNIIPAVLAVPRDQLFVNDPSTTEPARSVLLSNDVGRSMGAAPLLVVVGTADQTVVIERSRELLARLCAAGQVTAYTEYEGATHDDIGRHAIDEVMAWMAERVLAVDAPDECPPGPAAPTTTTTVPPTTAPTATTATTSAVPDVVPAALARRDLVARPTSPARPLVAAPRYTG